MYDSVSGEISSRRYVSCSDRCIIDMNYFSRSFINHWHPLPLEHIYPYPAFTSAKTHSTFNTHAWPICILNLTSPPPPPILGCNPRTQPPTPHKSSRIQKDIEAIASVSGNRLLKFSLVLRLWKVDTDTPGLTELIFFILQTEEKSESVKCYLLQFVRIGCYGGEEENSLHQHGQLWTNCWRNWRLLIIYLT
jgi:hypothetical protein